MKPGIPTEQRLDACGAGTERPGARDRLAVLPMGHDYPDERQHRIWRGMTSAEKYEVFVSHMDLMRDLKRAGVKALHPDWSAAQVEVEVARIYVHGQT